MKYFPLGSSDGIELPSIHTNICSEGDNTSLLHASTSPASLLRAVLESNPNDEVQQLDVMRRDSLDPITTEYVVLDFSNVLGVDATAARSCFLMLTQLMRVSGDYSLIHSH